MARRRPPFPPPEPHPADAYQNQIQPHFLFNALTTIQAYVRERPLLAEQLIESLARYGQGVLTRRGPVFLAEELALVHLYLALERARLGARLRTIFDVDAAALGMTVPALLVQPLVENAVVHAAARRAEGATLRLAVRFRPRGRLVVVMVADDGPGIERGPPHGGGSVAYSAAASGMHMGLRSVRLRLEAVYGPAGRLRVLRRLRGGTIAALSLPAAWPLLRRPGPWSGGGAAVPWSGEGHAPWSAP